MSEHDLFADDALLDAIAEGQPGDGSPVADLLAGWAHDVDRDVAAWVGSGLTVAGVAALASAPAAAAASLAGGASGSVAGAATGGGVAGGALTALGAAAVPLLTVGGIVSGIVVGGFVGAEVLAPETTVTSTVHRSVTVTETRSNGTVGPASPTPTTLPAVPGQSAPSASDRPAETVTLVATVVQTSYLTDGTTSEVTRTSTVPVEVTVTQTVRRPVSVTVTRYCSTRTKEVGEPAPPGWVCSAVRPGGLP